MGGDLSGHREGSKGGVVISFHTILNKIQA